MTLDRFEDLLAAYGADASRWPWTERAAAFALLEVSPEARSMRARWADFDEALRDAAPAPAREALKRAIREDAWQRRFTRSRVIAWRPAAAMAAALALGILAGATVGPFENASDSDAIAAEAESLIVGPEIAMALNGDG
jgi:hypothetical protein